MKPLVLLIGASGSGKTTVAQRLCSRYTLQQTASYTTRAPREDGEVGHIFCSRDEFESLRQGKQLVAWTEINGHHYGATRQQIDEADIYVVDPYGASVLADIYSAERKLFFVYLDVDAEYRENRMKERGSTDEEIRERLASDAQFLQSARTVSDKFDTALFVKNENLAETVGMIARFVGLQEGEN